MHHAASLCYVCAGNVDQAVAYWQQHAAHSSGGARQSAHAALASMQAVIEKSVVLGLATGTNKGSSASLSELVTAYASILASQVREGGEQGEGGSGSQGREEGPPSLFLLIESVACLLSLPSPLPHPSFSLTLLSPSPFFYHPFPPG
jgi:hypothetical protein